ncbi:MAG: threonine/serine dehydratase [Xanthomonadales bacterium]|jgi:threonine dehydratase|nr:threonine/serine dehydratase [Xanthomonadales bacterium]
MSQTDGGYIPDLSDIHLAHARIRKLVRQTPVINDPGLDEILGCRLFCKCENLQRTGAFKFRGATHAIARMREDGTAGNVATHSSGNHGAALALAARLDGRTAHVVMPENSSRIKIDAVRGYGGQVHFCAATNEARAERLEALVQQGMIPIHPYDDANIIAGQGTAALELEQAVPSLEQVITPIGGGGLISGTAIATRAWGVSIYGVEPSGAADTVESLLRGEIATAFQPDTIADGLRAIVGQRNFRVIRELVKQVLTVSDDEIREAMTLTWQTLKLVIEPSSATVIAAIRKHPEIFGGHKVGAIISGGNIHPADWCALTGTSSDPR